MNRFGFKNVPKVVWGIFLVTLVVNCGNYMAQFMSIFFTNKLGIKPNYSGIYVSLAGMAFLPGSLAGGKLSDVWGKKKVFLTFQGLAIIVTILNMFIFSKTVTPILFILNALFVAATIPVYNSTIFEVSDNDNKKDCLSLFFVGTNMGNMVSSIVGAAFFSKHYQLLFGVEVIMKILSLIIFGFLVNYDAPQKPQQIEKKEEAQKEKSESLWSVLFKYPTLLLFSLSCCLFSIILSQNTYALPIHLDAVFGDLGTRYYGIVLGINAFVIVIGTSVINNLTRKYYKLNLLLIATALVGCGFGLIYFGQFFGIYVITTLLWSCSDILNTPNSSAYISEFAPPDMLGRFAAWIKIVTGAGYAIGPIAIGFIIEHKGSRIVFPILFAIAVINFILLLFIKNMEKAENGKNR